MSPVVKYYDGTAWAEVSTAGPAGPTGPLGSVGPAGNGALNDLTDVDTVTTAPLAGNALVWNGAQWVPGTAGLQGSFLPLAGGTLSGPLVLAGDPVAPLEATPKQYVDPIPRTTNLIITTLNLGWTCPEPAYPLTVSYNATTGHLNGVVVHPLALSGFLLPPGAIPAVACPAVEAYALCVSDNALQTRGPKWEVIVLPDGSVFIFYFAGDVVPTSTDWIFINVMWAVA